MSYAPPAAAGVLRVRGVLQVDPVGAVAVGGAVGRGDVVGHALAAGVVVRRLDRARHGGGRPAERLVGARPAATTRGQGEGHVVEVPAVGVLVDGERLLSGGQGDADGDRGPGLIAAGVRDGDRAGQVGACGVGDVQRVGDPVRRRQPERDAVGSGGGHVDRVLEPLCRCRPAHVVRAAGRAGVLRVRGGLEVDPVGAIAVGGAVGRGDVVGHTLTAGVVVSRLDGARHRCRGAPVRSAGSGVGRVLHAGYHRQSGQDRGY